MRAVADWARALPLRPQFFIAEKLCITLEHARGFVSCDLHAILRGQASSRVPFFEINHWDHRSRLASAAAVISWISEILNPWARDLIGVAKWNEFRITP